MATFNGILKFGSFAIDGYTRPIPTKPWVTGGYPGSLSARGNGDIYALKPGETITLKNTDSNSNYQLTWVYIKDGNKQLYISTKVLVTNVSWDDLNAKGMIFGTPVTIDGKEYKLSVMTNYNWRGIVENRFNIVGLPIPTTEDTTQVNTYGQLDGKHNEVWNWWGIRTICQDIQGGEALCRGYSGANGAHYWATSDSSNEVGWRPVLERIEVDPPGKPIPIYPTSEDRTHPEPIQGKITLQTKYNGEGALEKMDVIVYNYTQQKFEYQSGEVDNTTGIMQLPVNFQAGNNYKITVRHRGTGGLAKEWLELYVIGGELGKYKISEPITIGQFENIKSYTGGENLIMKPQTFPETENSVVRLVPQTMNTLTAGETNTKELEFTASTKQPVIGDRLIKDKEIYTVASIQEGAKLNNVNSIVYRTTERDKPSISWTYRAGLKSYVYNGYAYLSYTDDPYFKITGIPLQGGETKNLWTGTEDKIRSMITTGRGNMLYTIRSTVEKTNLIASNLDTGFGKQVTLPRDGDQIGTSAVVDSKTGYLVFVAKEYDSVAKKYSCIVRWFDVSDLNNVTLVKQTILYENRDYGETGNPWVEDTQDIYDGNILVCFPSIEGDNCRILAYTFLGTVQDGFSAMYTINNFTKAMDAEVITKYIKDNQGESVLVLSVKYPKTSTSSNIQTITMKRGTAKHSSLTTTGLPVITHRITYSSEQGIGLVYAINDGNIYKRFTKAYDQAWDSVEAVGAVYPRAPLEQLFEVVDYNPYSYGKYPGLAILDYDSANKTDKLVLRSDYLMEEPRANKVILDKPISTSGGEQIKFLDYDLEVKAKDSIATITPTNITDSYYEYDAKFDKKEAERKVTVVGRNTKLTTLYYYNY
ncbi:hypothetical protein LAV60_16390 [Clostridium sporogenes]|uniref:hypothetical protein n=1 Tax=Clostridium sporogenes TaxID=1509 RepID=UPI00223876F3|nr:hypothetical protein [Clostridium sporogenes]MCW6094754.1 hypothetical protein [Clostridium sporogenes]